MCDNWLIIRSTAFINRHCGLDPQSSCKGMPCQARHDSRRNPCSHASRAHCSKKPPQIVVDTASGLAYEIDVPMSTLYTLPEVGQAVSLYLHLAIREDAHVLYGFASASERASFRQLIKITGIGARTALGILSGLSSDDLQQAIAQQDVSRLTSIPGIGKNR